MSTVSLNIHRIRVTGLQGMSPSIRPRCVKLHVFTASPKAHWLRRQEQSVPQPSVDVCVLTRSLSLSPALSDVSLYASEQDGRRRRLLLSDSVRVFPDLVDRGVLLSSDR